MRRVCRRWVWGRNNDVGDDLCVVPYTGFIGSYAGRPHAGFGLAHWQDFAGFAAAFGRADDAALFHDVDQTGGAGITDAQAAL